MLRGPHDDKFPQDGEQSSPAGDPEGEAEDAASLPSGIVRGSADPPREGARRISIPEPDGARRLSIPEPPSPPMTRRINIPDQTPPASNPDTKTGSTGRRKLNIPELPDTPAPAPAAPTQRSARRLGDIPEPVVPPAAPVRGAINPPVPAATPVAAGSSRANRPKTKTDLLVEKAQQIDSTVQMQRIRGRIDTCLAMTVSDILDWGNRNLQPLQQTSNKKAEIAAALSRIDAAGWINRTMEASCKRPSFIDRFTAQPPSYWEGMLQKTKTELMQFVRDLDKMKQEFFREIADLHLDAVAMLACVDEYADDSMKMAAQNRGKTLLMAHQTAAQLQMTIEAALDNCAKSCQQIDDVLSVTIPQWKMALGK